MILQLDPPIPLETPKGKGWAHFLIDYSQEHHLHWVVFIDETGECWTVPNPEVRIQSNWSLNRRKKYNCDADNSESDSGLDKS